MINIHDFKFFLSNSSFVDATIEDHTGKFEAEFIIPTHLTSISRSLSRAARSFQTAEDAFDWIVQQVLAYAKHNSLSIVWVDNPCNTPFVRKEDQITVLGNHIIGVVLLINGKP